MAFATVALLLQLAVAAPAAPDATTQSSPTTTTSNDPFAVQANAQPGVTNAVSSGTNSDPHRRQIRLQQPKLAVALDDPRSERPARDAFKGDLS